MAFATSKTRLLEVRYTIMERLAREGVTAAQNVPDGPLMRFATTAEDARHLYNQWIQE